MLMISILAALLNACSETVDDKAKSQPTTEFAAAYAGACNGVFGVTPVIEAAARDNWGSVGLDMEAIDQRFEPGDNFFCHVNGLWYKNFEMPQDKTRYGSFTLLRDKSEARVKAIIEELAEDKPDSKTLEGKVAAYYSAYFNTEVINAAGMAPAKPYL